MRARIEGNFFEHWAHLNVLNCFMPPPGDNEPAGGGPPDGVPTETDNTSLVGVDGDVGENRF